MFLSEEGPTLETLNFTIRIGSTPTFVYLDLYLYKDFFIKAIFTGCDQNMWQNRVL